MSRLFVCNNPRCHPLERKFCVWMQKHNKRYTSHHEFRTRYSNYLQNMKIEYEKQDSKVSAYFHMKNWLPGVYADMSLEDVRQMLEQLIK